MYNVNARVTGRLAAALSAPVFVLLQNLKRPEQAEDPDRQQ